MSAQRVHQIDWPLQVLHLHWLAQSKARGPLSLEERREAFYRAVERSAEDSGLIIPAGAGRLVNP